MGRSSWDRYYFDIAMLVASRSSCIRRKVGSVAVSPTNRIIGTGYNGAPSGMEHCNTDTCIRTRLNIPSGERSEICKALHAEQNLVLQLGDTLRDSTVYVTNQPCSICIKLLMGAGVKRIKWLYSYPDEYSTQLMGELGEVTSESTEDVTYTCYTKLK